MQLQTERLLLRPWREADAPMLYAHASDPLMGPAAGWQPHTSVENSREIIHNVLSAEENLAVVLKTTGEVIGSVGVMRSGRGHTQISEDEAELGYWIGRAYWGQGLIPEAVRELERYCFEELGCRGLWCMYFKGNEKSRRVQEKCGFLPHHIEEDVWCEALGVAHREHVQYLSRERWIKAGLAAKA